MEDKVRFIEHEGKSILYLDFSCCKADEVLHAITKARKIVARQAERSLLTLTNVTEARFNDAVTRELKELTTHNRPYVRAAAVVGVTGIKRIIFEAVISFSQRKISTFDTVDKAKQWLIEN